MKIIVLAAGQGYKLDGFNKLLLRNPFTKERIIESYIRFFGKENITFVLGYRAINVIHNYPDLNYIFNKNWATANNSLSLSMALDDNPTIVISGDLFLKDSIIEKIFNGRDNLVITMNNESRTSTSLNVNSDEKNIIHDIYQGRVRDINDYEAMGIYKISDKKILKTWKNNCIKNKHRFIGQNLDFSQNNIFSQISNSQEIFEINAPEDYLRFRDL